VGPPRGDRPIGLSVKKPCLSKSTEKPSRPKPACHPHQAVPLCHPDFTNRLNKPVPRLRGDRPIGLSVTGPVCLPWHPAEDFDGEVQSTGRSPEVDNPRVDTHWFDTLGLCILDDRWIPEGWVRPGCGFDPPSLGAITADRAEHIPGSWPDRAIP